MKKWLYLCLIGTFSLALPSLRAQDKNQEKPKAEEQKPAVPVKVQFVLTEFDGDKKISSMPYTFMVIAGGRFNNTSVRTGVRVPVETDGKDEKTTYMDVGMGIDCNISPEDEGRFRVNFTLDRSALYPNKSSEGERLVSQPNGQPLVRTFRTQEALFLKDGQTSENNLSTDPLNGHTFRLSMTINVQK
ncbi:MAG TPA: hypothetical protein VJN89_03345 [Candidatus Acidoferrum sp.]|nr:hypothetical protein [Candidatus Acidoferrum sp.]